MVWSTVVLVASTATGAMSESIAEAFVQAYSGADVDAVAALYADRVDHTNSGVISNAAIRKQAQEYFTRWPVRQWRLAGPVKTTPMGPSRQKVVFSASYDASNPQANKHASGIATETLIVVNDAIGAMKIVSQKEQTSKGSSSSSSDTEAPDVPGLQAAKAEYEASSHDETARVRYVTKLAEMSAQLTPKILHNPDVDAKEFYANQAGAIGDELRKHPMPRNVDSGKLTQLLIGEWASPRRVYVFRADGTYGASDEQRDKWRIAGNEYIDDVTRGPIILLDRNYFIYGCGQAVISYVRANDSEAEQSENKEHQPNLPEADAQSPDKQQLEAAKQEYEQSSHDESARSAYVTKLAKIRDQQIHNYWKNGDTNLDSATAVNEELRKHPAPANSDSKKLSQSLIGNWQSPRRTYVFRANGKWGTEGGTMDGSWRIKGNQLIEGSSSGTIILLNADYFIYSEGESVFFHARVK